ncbi:serine/threonine protein kinase [Nocardia tengchongensis]|uniref:non-specific serine/threonine protein kinase n=1 Tax=Nocardia tengchongensis TaxID=2055889 RepID=A0ABX8CP65_9NOCA|nr:serine/threonine-protein kinase [Nocardia tengchongensis]QVI21718.1 serine/threonine protein kinase [Nocardia tengchongensis]
MGDGYLGRYRLDELLGSGGSAEVWRAHDTVTDRTVALKVLAPVLTADPEYRERFEREARAASLLHGPHVVAVHTYGELEGRLFIESEFVDGLDIEALLEWEGPMTPDTAVELIAQVASALDEAHAAGLVHRDVKPQNIIVAPDDIAYLIDFGTAFQDGQTAITQTGMLVGTPAYMAPERFDGTISVRSDVYSLACVLYECLTGQRAFRVRNPAQLMRAHLERMPEPPSSLAPAVPAALDRVIARGLAKQPAERYATAGEFAAAARAALAESVAAATDPSVAATEIAAAAIEPGSATTEPIAAAAAARAAARRGASASGVDTRTVVLPMNSVPDTTPPAGPMDAAAQDHGGRFRGRGDHDRAGRGLDHRQRLRARPRPNPRPRRECRENACAGVDPTDRTTGATTGDATPDRAERTGRLGTRTDKRGRTGDPATRPGLDAPQHPRPVQDPETRPGAAESRPQEAERRAQRQPRAARSAQTLTNPVVAERFTVSTRRAGG